MAFVLKYHGKMEYVNFNGELWLPEEWMFICHIKTAYHGKMDV